MQEAAAALQQQFGVSSQVASQYLNDLGAMQQYGLNDHRFLKSWYGKLAGKEGKDKSTYASLADLAEKVEREYNKQA